jgi:DNA end-binding protein Ku
MVSFGLVTIPVKLYSTGETAVGIQLNMLHRKCGSRLKQQYVCPVDDVVVGRDEMVKGYEYAKGQYVLFTEDEIKALSREATNAMEITEFVPLEQVDPIYFEKSYYLGPDKGGERPYRLLAEAMRQTSRAALARYAARGKDYLVLLRPFEEGLIMQQLRYHDELRPFSEVPIGDAELREPELKLARQIIDQIANDRFEPETYEDEVRKQTMEMIEQKVSGQEITAAPVEAPKAQIIDLMAALKASLASGAQPQDAPGRPRSAASRRPAATPAASRTTSSASPAPPAPASRSAAESRRPVRTARAAATRPAKSVRAAIEEAAPAPRPSAQRPAPSPTLPAASALPATPATPAIIARKPPKPSPRTSLRETPAAAPARAKRKDGKR